MVFSYFSYGMHAVQEKNKLLARFEITHTHMFLSIKYLKNPPRKMKIVPEK